MPLFLFIYFTLATTGLEGKSKQTSYQTNNNKKTLEKHHLDLEEEITQILASLLEVASVYPSTCPYKIHKREFVVRRNGPREGMKTLIREPGYNPL